MTFGMQYNASGDPLLGRTLFNQPLQVSAEGVLSKLSYALAYSPAAVSAYGECCILCTIYILCACYPHTLTLTGNGNFSAAVEVVQQKQLCLSYLHHLALQRRVYNPLERGDVVAITNYLDMGLQMAIPLDATAETPPSSEGFLRMAAAWQVNKNLMVKARLGTDALTMGVAVKSWSNPALTVAASVGWNVASRAPVVGLQVHTDNIGALRYERAPPGMRQVGKRLVQRHVASQDDVDAAEGHGVTVCGWGVDEEQTLGTNTDRGHTSHCTLHALCVAQVPLEAQADPGVLGQLPSTVASDYL